MQQISTVSIKSTAKPRGTITVRRHAAISDRIRLKNEKKKISRLKKTQYV